VRERRCQQAVKLGVTERAWREWMRALGRQVRRTREFLGLTQRELAQRAGVSQGAVSRFEGGRAMSASFLTIVRLNVALAQALGTIDPSALSEEARRYLRFIEFLAVPPDAAKTGETPVAERELTTDPGSEAWIGLYRRVSPRIRATLLALALAAAEALEE
jgi:transcriptional regulator with XRE-family HTH domain